MSTELNWITVETTVHVPAAQAWSYWTLPEHVTQWNAASEDWHTPKAENDLRKGGKFSFCMEAKDGSFGFDFGGVYDEVQPNRLLSYTLGDERKVSVAFEPVGEHTRIIETFEPEKENSRELQQQGWQAIMDNFKKYVETVVHK